LEVHKSEEEGDGKRLNRASSCAVSEEKTVKKGRESEET